MTAPLSLTQLANKIKQFFDLHMVEPVSGFMPEDLAKFIMEDASTRKDEDVVDTTVETSSTQTLIEKLIAAKGDPKHGSLSESHQWYRAGLDKAIVIALDHLHPESDRGEIKENKPSGYYDVTKVHSDE